MVDALNSLNFYKVDFEVTLTEEYNKKLREAEVEGNIINNGLDVVSRIGKLQLSCVKSFSATNESEAKRKIIEFLDSKIENKEIEQYQVNNMKSNTFKEELEIKGLDKLFYHEI